MIARFERGWAGFSSMEIRRPSLVGLADPVALGVLDRVAEQHAAVVAVSTAATLRCSSPEKPGPWKMLSPSTSAARVVADVVGADEERLREPVR